MGNPSVKYKTTTEMAIVLSGRADLNRRPHGPELSAAFIIPDNSMFRFLAYCGLYGMRTVGFVVVFLSVVGLSQIDACSIVDFLEQVFKVLSNKSSGIFRCVITY